MKPPVVAPVGAISISGDSMSVDRLESFSNSLPARFGQRVENTITAG
ncbi:hypothetical protein AB0J63_39695 [Streptosporangium canum]